MQHYIIENKILGFENELDTSLYDYPKLTQEQVEFYELNKCSLYEVLNLTLNPKPTLDELKAKKIKYFSQLAFDERAKILPEYKLINASLGVYNATETERIRLIVEHYRSEFYRLEGLCKQATTAEELEAIQDNY